ncbi:hypothetical protein LB518_24315 [Mesorhizobium sp. BR1-1-16]|uniref:hypothetical protein n=1 Tax=Mesorhizobium sp. BR1-1-16 TaxID=2876653 RepID=UPI001CCDFBF7|nr:hypothetical protein [Mesorhizobium sp. BR1-1-16]MBZ9939433.1 hypothetical protein [Mesorhizobium sp. BR1-1-16]
MAIEGDSMRNSDIADISAWATVADRLVNSCVPILASTEPAPKRNLDDQIDGSAKQADKRRRHK